jgi:uncharacterized protein
MVRDRFLDEGSGHDWWHIYRVWRMTIELVKNEAIQNPLDHKVAEISALLHDIADHKFHDGDLEIGPKKAFNWCEEHLSWNSDASKRVASIIRKLSFKGAGVEEEMTDEIGKIVQDADRLDAIGAIGIARTFAYGGHKNQPLYDPQITPVLHASFEDYHTKRTTTINHFYEKLLLLHERINTKSAKKIAEERTNYMHTFLQQFYEEWYLR